MRPSDELEPGPADSQSKPSIGSLVAGITSDLSTLVRKEIELAKLEVSEILKEKLRGAALGVVGLILVALFLPLLLLFFIEVLAIWLERWAATGIVTLFVATASGIAFVVAARALKGKFIPEKTIKTIKEDVRWAKDLRRS